MKVKMPPNQLRRKGRFVKKSVLEREMKAKVGKARVKLLNQRKENSSTEKRWEGRRILELDTLGKNLQCCNCGEVLSLLNIIKENRKGLLSILTVKCLNCNSKILVSTGKTHTSKLKINGVETDTARYADVNSKAVLGVIRSGDRCTGLNKKLIAMNIPCISKEAYKRYKRKVGPAIEKAAKESCKRAAEEERKLMLEKVDELCKNV